MKVLKVGRTIHIIMWSVPLACASKQRQQFFRPLEETVIALVSR